MTIVAANSGEQIKIARNLFLEYAKELNVDLCFQNFAAELENLPGKNAPPYGSLLLAMQDQQAVGCVALRRLSPTYAEMKRLYNRPAYRHFGIGRELTECIVERGRELGYRRVVLDTLDSMQGAQALYRSLGFASIEPYYDNPLPDALYFARDLILP